MPPGTPIGGGGLHDMASLMRLLKFAPLDQPAVFKDSIQKPWEAEGGDAEGGDGRRRVSRWLCVLLAARSIATCTHACMLAYNLQITPPHPTGAQAPGGAAQAALVAQ